MTNIEELEDLTKYVTENKNKYYGFIYITINLENSMKYIGQKSIDKSYKWNSYLGSGVYLNRAINKFGKDKFKRIIVDLAKTKDELNDKEKHWIFKYNCVKSEEYYNLIEGGQPTPSLMQSNLVSCICLGTNFIFESIVDASKWSGYPESYIKRSFDIDYKPNTNHRYVFRRLGYFKPSDKLCFCCGKIIDKYRVKGSFCKHCSIKINDNDILRNVKCDYDKSVPIYSIKDEKIKQYLTYHNEDMILKRERKEERERNRLLEFESFLNNNKEIIYKWYFEDKIPSTKILTLLDIKNTRKNKELKNFLEKLKIKKGVDI